MKILALIVLLTSISTVYADSYEGTVNVSNSDGTMMDIGGGPNDSTQTFSDSLVMFPDWF